MSVLESNALYFAECLKLLERIPDESIHLIYVDPPWNEPETEPHTNGANDEAWMRRVLRQYWRVLRSDGNLLVHTKQGRDLAIVDLLNETFGRRNAREEVILPTGTKPPAGRRYEYIRRYAKNGHNRRELPEGVWEYRAYDDDKDFQVDYPVRPVGLIETLIEHSTPPDGIVLDTFLRDGTNSGSGAPFETPLDWFCDKDEKAIADSQKNLARYNATVPHEFRCETQEQLKSFPVERSSVYPTFFISYARADSEKYVDDLCRAMREEYIYLWRDKDSIPGGSEWRKELEQAAADCDALILFMTPTSAQSEWVRWEYEFFLGRGRKIFPILCENGDGWTSTKIAELQQLSYADRERILKELKPFAPVKDLQSV
ncbi:MAG: TIR domain-containing protein [Chloroflexi bacterium]|uniref:TIR domain-containing protein n=1 Tax=Candidatus Flexifilum breve TaxID=3140694 RepID=UPI003135E6B3|nr:TIR domain-containing protein [Chloroflexota bacterium]